MKTNAAMRISSGILGLATAVVTLMIPVTVYIDITTYSDWKKLYPSGFWSMAGLYTFAAVTAALFLSLTYLFWRYALTDVHSETTSKGFDVFFKSLLVAGIAVIVASVASQFAFLLVQLVRHHEILGSGHDGLEIEWSPYMWQLTRGSPIFLVFVLLLFVFSFYWKYRRIGRS